MLTHCNSSLLYEFNTFLTTIHFKFPSYAEETGTKSGEVQGYHFTAEPQTQLLDIQWVEYTYYTSPSHIHIVPLYSYNFPFYSIRKMLSPCQLTSEDFVFRWTFSFCA